MQFCLYPIERTARKFPLDIDDDDFDASLLPIDLVEGARIEDVSPLISSDEFEVFKRELGVRAIEKLEKMKYAIIHRFPDSAIENGEFVSEVDLLHRSQNIVAEMETCLRIIRPTNQHTQMCWGRVNNNGGLYGFGFQNPLEFTASPANQIFFKIRTIDLNDLVVCAPLFRAAMHGPYWKFRMAVQMHEAGHFQNTDWKARYFLWSSALEALFTSKGQNWREHSGSLVASERIKALLGSQTPVYPPGELLSDLRNPGTTVESIIGELYCLRNHIAHGDRVPDYYFQSPGRVDVNGSLNKVMVLIEAISFIVRKTLVKILRDGLISHFADDASLETYYTAQGLTRTDFRRMGLTAFACPS